MANPDAWFEKLSFLISNPQARLDMGRAARKSAESNFSIERVVDQHLEIFRSLVSAEG